MTRMVKAKSKESKGGLLERIIPILLIASIGLAFLVGVLWQKVSELEKGGAKVTNTGGQDSGTNTGQPVQPQGPTQGKLSEDQAKKVPTVDNNDHVRGNKNAQVFLIEYSDLQCPFCQKFHPTTQQVLKEYGDKVALVYRHFPLDQIHPRARPAAEASECVANLGGNDAFWKFVDAVYADQQSTLNNLAQAANKAGVNQTSFQSCIDAGKFKDKVEDQYQKGLAAGVTGTPGNFIVNKNGEAWLIPGALPFESIKATIDEALKS